MWRRRGGVLGVALAVLVRLPPSALAQTTGTAPASPSASVLDEESATRLFAEGLAAFDRGEPRGAVERWERLFASADPERAWRVLYNLGLAYEAAGDRPRAFERFSAFARRVGEQPGSLPIEFEDRRQDAVERAARLRPHLSLLRVNAPASGERVVVRLGDEPPRDAGFSRWLEPGRYVLRMGEGSRVVTEQVELAPGELETIAARQGPPPPPPAPPPYEPPIAPGVLVGVGAGSLAAIALPVALFVRAEGLREDAASLPTFDARYPSALEDYEDARTAYQASWALPATLAATSLALLVVDLVDASSRTSAGSPRVRALASSSFLGLRLEAW